MEMAIESRAGLLGTIHYPNGKEEPPISTVP